MIVSKIAKEIARKLDMKSTRVQKILNLFVPTLAEQILTETSVVLYGIGKFEIRTQKPLMKYTKRNDPGKDMYFTPARNILRFIVSASFKKKVNELPKVFASRKDDDVIKDDQYGRGTATCGNYKAEIPRPSEFVVSQICRIKEEFRGDRPSTGCYINRILDDGLVEIGRLDMEGYRMFEKIPESQLSPYVYRKFWENHFIESDKPQTRPLPKHMVLRQREKEKQ